ncbi:MAG: hypothetical protein RMH81_09485 [Thermomicrobium sp.]|nr:hypothetical protein [Thermomicrobium sp.]
MTTEVLRALRDDQLGARFPQDDWIDAPARVDGLELLGRLPDSGFEGEQWLAALDGRHFALTPVVYRILECADGRTPLAEIADRVRRSTGRAVSAEDVRWLIEHRLAPAGLVRRPMPSGSVSRSQEPATKGLLRIRARVPLLQPAWIAPLTAILQHAFWQPLVLLLLTAIVVVHLWIYSSGLSTLGEASMLLFHEPRWILLVFAMEIGASLFHELGHAAAMRRSRCPHGPIGLGVYLIWPVFYTDVTPIYRLRRRERLRVDLGGMYFHQIAALGFVGLYAVTGFPLWLLGVIIADVQCLRQFNPFFRFDGYYILADLLGVPDPLSQIGPFLRRLVRRERVPGLQLRRSTEVLFLGYLGLVVVYFVLPYAIGWELGDEIVHTIWITGSGFGEAFGAAWRAADPLLFAAVTIQFFFWLLSVLGLVLFGWTALSLSIGLARRVWAFRGKARTP